MGCSTIRRQSADSIGHSPHEMSSPCPASAFEDFFDVQLPSSRPVSEAYMSGNSTPAGAMGARPPSLTDILLDVASPPWTLSAFMAYLSQNHCMESLEFTLDSQRYTAFYNELIMDNSARTRDSDDRVCSLWEKLMQVYIISCAPREVNLPASVRDHLLSLPCGPTPPHPSQLDEAGRIIYELMNDSLLVPFIQSVSPLHLDSHDDHIRSPRFASHSKMGPIRSTTSMQTLESESLTDDSECNSPPAMEPMTPPTTPPTSEWSFNTHHGGFHRAVVAHNKGWKKVGAKLGFKTDMMSHYGSDCEDVAPDSRLPSQAKSVNGRDHILDAGHFGEFREDTVGNFATRDGHKPHLVHRSIRMRMRPSGKSFNNSTRSHPPQPQILKSTYQPKSPLSVQPIEVDPAHEMYIDVGTSHLIPRTGSDASLTLSDFSNYLPSQPSSHHAEESIATTLEQGCDFRFASPPDDFYGWDAELDRRSNTTPCAMETCSNDCETVALSYRRANGVRHNLLQRVFKVGSATSLKYESSH